ncbi:MAG TPA: C40 family peptidase, partial [Anaerolineae bacterium]|nr:C40 family peptidase [Anaerolineae bacterium]
VHEERLFEWVTRVLDFLVRRGDDANDALYRLRRARYADERETTFEVRASMLGESVVLEGQVLTADQRDAALSALPVKPVEDRVRVLLTEETPHALVNRSVADVRREPRGLSELMTEALVGESARILEERDGWTRVRLDRDGYLGWMRAGSLLRCGPAEVEAYQAAKSAIVIAELALAYASPLLSGEPRKREASHGPGVRSGKLPFGVALPVAERRDSFAAVRLPDGRLWWVAESDLMPLADRPGPDAEGMAFALNLLRRCVGVPYLWGGRTPFGFDCSGFAQTLWSFVGVPIPRDADQQFRAGIPVEGTPQPGDLLYFGEAPPLSPPQGGGDERGGITHVAISLGGDELLHSNGTDWSVAYNSLNPASPIYRAWLKEHLAGVRRFADR